MISIGIYHTVTTSLGHCRCFYSRDTSNTSGGARTADLHQSLRGARCSLNAPNVLRVQNLATMSIEYSDRRRPPLQKTPVGSETVSIQVPLTSLGESIRAKLRLSSHTYTDPRSGNIAERNALPCSVVTSVVESTPVIHRGLADRSRRPSSFRLTDPSRRGTYFLADCQCDSRSLSGGRIARDQLEFATVARVPQATMQQGRARVGPHCAPLD
jgi:hypothetical protein